MSGYNPPESLLPWLTHQSSLTEKLITEVGEAKLEILNQNWVKPNWWDKFTLGLSVESVMHREILMSAWQTPCWYARTIIPDFSYHANHTFFERLKHESLGVIVFNTPIVKRAIMLNYSINSQCLEYHWLPSYLIDKESMLWARLSIFTLSDKSPFYLIEIFLPALIGNLN